jgi:hypothetical protein
MRTPAACYSQPVLSRLRVYYDEKGIGAARFRCAHETACRGAGGSFTTAKESFVGPEYERGNLPRLLFLSLDSGSGRPNPGDRTLQAVRAQELATDVNALPKGKHWYLTHELAFYLLEQFDKSLTVEGISPYFAHVNSAKCCMNNPQRKQAADILFENCRSFIAGELEILQPDIIVTQGAQARRAVESSFRYIRLLDEACGVAVIRQGDRAILWIPTHHPSAYGAFWKQKKDCWARFRDLAGQFMRDRSSALKPKERDPKVGTTVRQPETRQLLPPVQRAALAPPSGARPNGIEELINASKAVTSPASFLEFVTRMQRMLPGPEHRHKGLFTGMRVQRFQNWQLDQNARYRLTDAQILAVMRVEFPQAIGKVFTADLTTGLGIVAGIRSDYNRTGHNGPTPQERGMQPSVSYGRF